MCVQGIPLREYTSVSLEQTIKNLTMKISITVPDDKNTAVYKDLIGLIDDNLFNFELDKCVTDSKSPPAFINELNHDFVKSVEYKGQNKIFINNKYIYYYLSTPESCDLGWYLDSES